MCIIKTPFPGYLGDSATTSNPGEEAITDYTLQMMMMRMKDDDDDNANTDESLVWVHLQMYP